MYQNILIPTDGSDLATKAVEQGVRFAKEIGAKITAVTVTEPFQLLSVAPSQLEYTPIEYKKHADTYAEKVLGIVSAAAKSAGVGCETLHVEHEHVYQAIIDAAAARRCGLILMASHGRRGVSAVVLGSVVEAETVEEACEKSISDGIDWDTQEMDCDGARKTTLTLVKEIPAGLNETRDKLC